MQYLLEYQRNHVAEYTANIQDTFECRSTFRIIRIKMYLMIEVYTNAFDFRKQYRHINPNYPQAKHTKPA